MRAPWGGGGVRARGRNPRRPPSPWWTWWTTRAAGAGWTRAVAELQADIGGARPARAADPVETRARIRTGARIVETELALKATQDALRVQSTRDGVTGSWNHASILDMLSKERERARRKMSFKRGSGAEHVCIEDVDVAARLPDERSLLIDEALARLEATDPELARVVTLKFYGGLTNVEVAEVLGVTERTVQNKWTFAKAWLLESILEETNSPTE